MNGDEIQRIGSVKKHRRQFALVRSRLAQKLLENSIKVERGRFLARRVILQHHASLGDAVDVSSLVPHHPVAVTADVGDPDIVTHDHDDVGFLGLGVDATCQCNRRQRNTNDQSFWDTEHEALCGFARRCVLKQTDIGGSIVGCENQVNIALWCNLGDDSTANLAPLSPPRTQVLLVSAVGRGAGGEGLSEEGLPR